VKAFALSFFPPAAFFCKKHRFPAAMRLESEHSFLGYDEPDRKNHDAFRRRLV
jgi:hypothetical protein